MSLDQHKITSYEDNVKDLPDYPSDAGITAKNLKVMVVVSVNFLQLYIMQLKNLIKLK